MEYSSDISRDDGKWVKLSRNVQLASGQIARPVAYSNQTPLAVEKKL